MRGKWKHSGQIKGLHYSVIEEGPSIKQIYGKTHHLLADKSVSILGIDGPQFLDSRDREVLHQQFKEAGIRYEEISEWFWIQAEDVPTLFGRTDFGEAADTCLFTRGKPVITGFKKRIPRMEGRLKDKPPADIVRLLELQQESGAIYMTSSDAPDLVIVTSDWNYIEYIDTHFQY